MLLRYGYETKAHRMPQDIALGLLAIDRRVAATERNRMGNWKSKLARTYGACSEGNNFN